MLRLELTFGLGVLGGLAWMRGRRDSLRRGQQAGPRVELWSDVEDPVA